MIFPVKVCTVYLIALAVFVASASAGVDGMVLCICGNGGVAIEKSCGDDSVCCNDSHAPNVSPVSEDQCNTCTDLPLNGLDAPLSYSSRTTLKIALDTHDASPLLAAATCKIVNNRGPAQPVVCAQSAATFSAVFRI